MAADTTGNKSLTRLGQIFLCSEVEIFKTLKPKGVLVSKSFMGKIS